MNNWFCNRDNSTELLVALPDLLYHELLCGRFAANLVVIIQITLLFILKFHHNVKWANYQDLSICYCRKSIAAEKNVSSTLIIINLLICSLNNWNLWFTDCLTSCSIDWYVGPTMNWGCFSYSHCTSHSYLILVS